MFEQKKFLWLLRLVLGFIFLWAFLDKLIGLGFATAPDKAWLNGGSPTAGFLKFATHGPLAGWFQSLSGSAWVDWLFMLGLLAIGLGLITGIMMRLATIGGVVLMALMYLSLLPPENNPIFDEHIVYILVLILVGTTRWDNWWSRTSLVQKRPWLV